MQSIAIDLVNSLWSRTIGKIRKHRLLLKLRSPKESQQDALARIVKHNQESEIGAAFGFSTISNIREYQSQLGIFSYQRLLGYLRRQEQQNSWVTFSGLSSHEIRSVDKKGHVKSMPRSLLEVNHLSKDMTISTSELLRIRGFFRGKYLGLFNAPLTAPANSTTKKIDSNVGIVYRSHPNYLHHRNILEPAVANIRSIKRRYLGIAFLALRTTNLSSLVTGNPLTLLYLMATIETEFERLCTAIEQGQVPEVLRQYPDIKETYTPDKKRANYLRKLRIDKEKLTFSDFWPRLRGVVCWSSGSFRTAVRNLRRYLDEGTPIIELGHVGDGFLGTLNIDSKTNACVPMLNRVFYEFTERNSWEVGFSPIKLLHELMVGQEYYVFVTTESGLYRYETNDVIRVTGRVHNTPTWEVISYDANQTNLLGENLSESHVSDAIEYLNEVHDCSIDQYLLLADKQTGNYDLYVESESDWRAEEIKNLFDDALSRTNSSWATLRQTDLLRASTITRLPVMTLLQYRAEVVPDSHLDSCFSTPNLQYRQECRLNLPKPVHL